jgi:hypothetical protein
MIKKEQFDITITVLTVSILILISCNLPFSPDSGSKDTSTTTGELRSMVPVTFDTACATLKADKMYVCRPNNTFGSSYLVLPVINVGTSPIYKVSLSYTVLDANKTGLYGLLHDFVWSKKPCLLNNASKEYSSRLDPGDTGYCLQIAPTLITNVASVRVFSQYVDSATGCTYNSGKLEMQSTHNQDTTMIMTIHNTGSVAMRVMGARAVLFDSNNEPVMHVDFAIKGPTIVPLLIDTVDVGASIDLYNFAESQVKGTWTRCQAFFGGWGYVDCQ